MQSERRLEPLRGLFAANWRDQGKNGCVLTLVLLILTPIIACSRQQPTSQAPPDSANNPAMVALSPEDKAVIQSRLLTADSADGATDKVVHKCYMCQLRMEGQAENQVIFEGYRLDFCSSHCAEAFRTNPAKTLLTLSPDGL